MANFMSNLKKNIGSDPKTPKEPKSKRRKLDIWNKLAIGVLSIFLVGCISVFFILVNIVNDPDGMRFNKDGLITTANTRIYDGQGNIWTEMGSEIREDISYDQIPQCVIDAFLSIEDSRFFEHNGFDLPRFMAAALTNLRTGDFSQGGSTLTMQMIDNAFTKQKEESLKESGSYSKIDQIKLKIQEIYLSLIAEQSIDKEAIFEFYVNRIWFGSGGNTRGIQKAANYYFNKDVSQLNVGEAAFLAGAINAPDYYNPINNVNDSDTDHLQLATERRNTTLQMMLQHGYITEEEYNLYVNSDLSFALQYTTQQNSNPYSAFLDQVLTEAIQLTGQDPAIVPMDIYTTLDTDLQNQANAIINGEIFAFPDEAFDVGFTVVDNDTGEVLAVGPGRFYDPNSADRKDASTMQRSPGSSMKPLLSYVSTFDLLGWSTVHTVNDKAKDYFHAGTNLGNSDGRYDGKMTLARALGVSKNTPAAQAMIDLVAQTGYDYWIDYCKKLGYTDDVASKFVEQYCIGGADMQASSREQASAYTIFANGGKRIEDHTIRKIVYRNDNSEVTPNLEPIQVVSEQAAWMMSQLLYDVVNGNYGMMNDQLASSAYPIYGKSGTSDWGIYGLKYNIPQAAIRDEWSVGYSSAYTVACWSGYQTQHEQLGYYIPVGSILSYNMAFEITDYLLDYLSSREQYVAIPRPDGITDYKGGYIKSEFASKGDPDTTTTDKSDDDKDDENDTSEAQAACEAEGGTWDAESSTCVKEEEPEEPEEPETPTPEEECIASGGTWDGSACTYPPTPEEECIADGGTWNGTACEYGTVDPNPNPGGESEGPNQGGTNPGNTGQGGNTQPQNPAAIISWDPRKLIQELLNLF